MPDSFSRYEVYTSVHSKYCYSYSCVLKNRFGIHDAIELKTVESDIFAVRQKQLLREPIKGSFSPSHLCHLHRYLFGDVYSFAGHFRTEDISKGKTLFLHYAQISNALSELLKELKSEKYLSDFTFPKLIDRVSYYFASLNYIHPFRDGNGRTTREFIRMLLEQRGYSVDWSKIDHELLLLYMENSIYDYKVLLPVIETIIIPVSNNL